MKAFLLAAGHGTRLRPLTDVRPKCLVPVRGQPLLKIWLDICATSEIDEVIINLHSHADSVEEYLQQNEPPVKVHVVREDTLLRFRWNIAGKPGIRGIRPSFLGSLL